jgi:hypothetical protein
MLVVVVARHFAHADVVLLLFLLYRDQKQPLGGAVVDGFNQFAHYLLQRIAPSFGDIHRFGLLRFAQ